MTEPRESTATIGDLFPNTARGLAQDLADLEVDSVFDTGDGPTTIKEELAALFGTKVLDILLLPLHEDSADKI